MEPVKVRGQAPDSNRGRRLLGRCIITNDWIHVLYIWMITVLGYHWTSAHYHVQGTTCGHQPMSKDQVLLTGFEPLEA